MRVQLLIQALRVLRVDLDLTGASVPKVPKVLRVLKV